MAEEKKATRLSTIERLKKELAEAEKRASAQAKKRRAALNEQLERATISVEKANARRDKILAEIAELDGTTEGDEG